jgi:hypothetical protein
MKKKFLCPPHTLHILTKMQKITYVCTECGSDDIRKDAVVAWDVETQTWVLTSIFDNSDCCSCGNSGNYAIKIKEV